MRTAIMNGQLKSIHRQLCNDRVGPTFQFVGAQRIGSDRQHATSKWNENDQGENQRKKKDEEGADHKLGSV